MRALAWTCTHTPPPPPAATPGSAPRMAHRYSPPSSDPNGCWGRTRGPRSAAARVQEAGRTGGEGPGLPEDSRPQTVLPVSSDWQVYRRIRCNHSGNTLETSRDQYKVLTCSEDLRESANFSRGREESGGRSGGREAAAGNDGKESALPPLLTPPLPPPPPHSSPSSSPSSSSEHS